MKVVQVLRANVGVVAVSAAVILGGAGAATAMVGASSDAPAGGGAQVSDQAPAAVSSTPAATSAAPASTAAPVVEDATPVPSTAQESQVQARTATVPDVTQPQQTAAPEPADPAADGVGVTGDDGQYTPANVPGGVIAPPPVPLPKLPGEPGYVAPEAPQG